jgi:hypothetical protein
VAAAGVRPCYNLGVASFSTGRRPSVLIVGGFATAPPNYWPLRRRLLRRGAARVDICLLWPPDWLLAGILGFGAILRRTGRAVAQTYVAGGRQPIIVVAHSAGGIATRLAMSKTPFNGRVAGVSEAVGCLVTLGTPHGLGSLQNRYQHAGHHAVAFLERETPGAYFAPRTAYLTVGSRAPAGRLNGRGGGVVEEVFRMMVGEDVTIGGDGVVPVGAVHLEGAEQLTFDGVGHGMIGAPWYGNDEVVDRWWPTAVALWEQALEARARDEQASASTASEHDSAKSLEFEVAGWSSGSSSGS